MPINIQIKDEAGRFADAKIFIEQLFPYLPEHGDFDMHDVICNAKLNDWPTMLNCQDEMNTILMDYDYAEKGKHFKGEIALTQKGREAKIAGGHLKYQKKMRDADYKHRNLLIAIITLFVTIVGLLLQVIYKK